ncbi:unnamed protein product [Schistosoma turkestanicum]|nr:unnamed protein product [Schistosoma turkestanicum]
MIKTLHAEHNDDQNLPYESFPSSDYQVPKSMIESSINDQVTCASVDQMSKKPSGRSWARSKRISLGCFEWNSRGLFRQTDIGSSNRLNSINPSGSHNCIVHNEDFTYICQESSKPKFKSGADSLLQRLRKRSFSRDKHKRDNKIEYCRSSSAPRSVYSYQSSPEFEINHLDKHSFTLINKCNNLFASNLIPQISLSRSVPELKNHSCLKPSGYLDKTMSYQYNVTSSEFYPKSSTYLKSCFSSQSSFPVNNDKTDTIAAATTTTIARTNSNQMELSRIANSSYTLPMKNKTTINHELYLQTNYHTSINDTILHGNFVSSSIAPTSATMTDSSYLGSNSDCMDIPHTMKYSDSFVLSDKKQQYQAPHNPLVSSMYSEVCPECCFTYDNNNQNTAANNGQNLQLNSLSYSYGMKHSPAHKSNNSLNVIKFNGNFTNGENQLVTLSIPTTTTNPSTMTTDHLLNNSNIVDLDQTQNNSSCNSLRPDSLLSTSTTTTTTRESSCSDLSPNSMSSHDSALGGEKFQSDIGLLKTICPGTITTSSTTNCMKNIEQLNYLKSSDVSTCINNNNSSLNPKDLYPIPPLCVPAGSFCCSHTPPTPIRRPWLGNNSGQLVTGRSRSTGQKRSVYVNSSIYPIPEMIRNNDTSVNSRSGYARDQQNSTDTTITTSSSSNPVNTSKIENITVISNHTNDKTTLNNISGTPVPYWTHLLPYRTSTVPQNLSGRLRKSETLPNDWIDHESNKIVDHTTHSIPKSTSYQLNSLSQNHNAQHSNHFDGCKSRSYVNFNSNHIINTTSTTTNNNANNNNNSVTDNTNNVNRKETKSPPPRPPIRTSSHVVPRQNITSSLSSSYCHHRHCQRHFASGLLDKSTKANTNEHSNNNILTENSNDKSIGESPILCRYSQLYSLNAEARNTNTNDKSNNTNSPYSHNTVINNMTSSNYSSIDASNKRNTAVHPHQYILYEQRQQQQQQQQQQQSPIHHHHQHSVQYHQCQSHPSNNRSNYKQLVDFDMKKLGK